MLEKQELNGLPKGWQNFKLGEVAKYINGKAFKPSEWSTEGLPIIRIQNLNKDKASFNYCNFEVDEKFIVSTGDLLFAWSGTPDTSFGAHIWNGEKAVLNQHIFRIEINEEKIDKKFYLHALNNKVKEFVNKAHGTAGLAHITKKKFEEAEIAVPSIEKQQQIVFKIEKLFSELDKGIEELKTVQQQLKVYRQAVLKWAFEGKLTNENVKDGALPEGWKIVQIQELAEKNKHALKAGPFGSSLKKEFYTAAGYKIYGQEQVINDDPFFGDYYITEGKYLELSSCKVKPFDILISLVGTVGKVLLLPENCQQGIINPRLIKISLDNEIYLPKFFKYYFESATVKSFYSSETRGTTMDVLNLGIIKTIPFPLCSIEEQRQIVQEIESRLSVCVKIEETIADCLKQAEALRQSILKKAFEGKLVLPENTTSKFITT